MRTLAAASPFTLLSVFHVLYSAPVFFAFLPCQYFHATFPFELANCTLLSNSRLLAFFFIYLFIPFSTCLCFIPFLTAFEFLLKLTPTFYFILFIHAFHSYFNCSLLFLFSKLLNFDSFFNWTRFSSPAHAYLLLYIYFSILFFFNWVVFDSLYNCPRISALAHPCLLLKFIPLFYLHFYGTYFIHFLTRLEFLV